MSESAQQSITDFQAAQDKRREALARLISAELGGLVNDACGERLPDRLWHQAIPRAEAMLVLIGRREVRSVPT